MNDCELIDRLEKATKNLYWISESDSTWQVFLWEEKEAITPEKMLAKLGFNPDTAIEICELNNFFLIVTEEQDWHNEEEAQEVKRYQELVSLLKTNLSDLKIYRIGNIEIDIYIVGKTESGKLAGLSTKVVET
jgi:hypothetical protein